MNCECSCVEEDVSVEVAGSHVRISHISRIGPVEQVSTGSFESEWVFGFEVELLSGTVLVNSLPKPEGVRADEQGLQKQCYKMDVDDLAQSLFEKVFRGPKRETTAHH